MDIKQVNYIYGKLYKGKVLNAVINNNGRTREDHFEKVKMGKTGRGTGLKEINMLKTEVIFSLKCL